MATQSNIIPSPLRTLRHRSKCASGGNVVARHIQTLYDIHLLKCGRATAPSACRGKGIIKSRKHGTFIFTSTFLAAPTLHAPMSSSSSSLLLLTGVVFFFVDVIIIEYRDILIKYHLHLHVSPAVVVLRCRWRYSSGAP